jgi:prepilin-type N-terminal cleavage/methylation domain-containing protein
MKLKKSSGFTLVEVIVALGLMAMAMLAIAPLFVNAIKTNGEGQDYSVLNMLAKERLEEVLQYNFTDTRLTVPTGATVWLNDSTGTAKQVSGQLYRNQFVQTQTASGVSISFPYELVYVVQNFNLSTNNQIDFTTPVDDGNATWTTQNGVRLITVFAASGRSSLGGTAYDLGSSTTTASDLLLSSTSTGKQIRMSAVKAP